MPNPIAAAAPALSAYWLRGQIDVGIAFESVPSFQGQGVAPAGSVAARTSAWMESLGICEGEDCLAVATSGDAFVEIILLCALFLAGAWFYNRRHPAVVSMATPVRSIPAWLDPFSRRPQTRLTRYILAVGVVAIAAVARYLLQAFFGTKYVFITYYPATVLAAAIGGFGPGVLATILSGVTAHLIVFDMGKTLVFGSDDAWALALFSTMGLSISALAQALYHARHRHLLLLETALLARVADGFFALDEDYRFRYVNPAGMQSLGLSAAADVIGRALADTISHAGESDFFRAITQAVGERRAIHREVANPAGVGWLELHAYPSAAGVSVYFSDVTERRLMENLLRDGEARLSGILNSAMDAIVSIDDNQRIVLFNPAAENLFRYAAGDVIGKPIEQLMPERYRARHASYVKQFDESGATRRMMRGYGEVIGLRADGEELNLDISISKGVHTHSKIFTAIIRDITQKMRMEQELRSSQNLLQATLSAMNARIAVLDHQGTIIKVNDAWERFSRETAGDRYGQQGVGQNYLTVCDAVTGKDRDAAAEIAAGLRAVIAGQRDHFGYEYPCDSPERAAWYLLSANPIRGDIAGAVVAHIDITAQKTVETALAGAVRQLRELAGAVQDAEEGERKRIALELHDELGQDLTALRLELTWLESRLGKVPGEELSPKIADLKGRLEATMRAVRRIISDLRPSMLDELGLTPALEWLAEDFTARTGVACRVSVVSEDIEVPDRLATAIFRIVQEALTNVWRHAEATQVEIQVESSRDASMVVTVHDDGVGVASESLDKPKSFGIRGMRERAALFGGLVQLQSLPGKGTTVRISFPWPSYGEALH